MKAAAPQPSPPLPKAAAAPLTPVLEETPPIEELDEEKTKERDAGMTESLAERVLRPARPKAAVNTGYADLVGAARNRPASSSPDVGASSGATKQSGATSSPGHHQTLTRVVRSSVHAEPAQSLQFKLATELVRDEEDEVERESAVQRKWDPSLAGDAPLPPDDGGEPLQRKETGAGAPGEATTPSQIHAIARAGVEGASEPLPYLDRIQPLLAPHDLSGVRTVTGGAAADANARLGALGYTIGDRIAFRTTPNVRLAAHEAAHVVQQRLAVAAPDSVGPPDDHYERQADAVATAATQSDDGRGLAAMPPLGTAVPRVQTAPAEGGQCIAPTENVLDAQSVSGPVCQAGAADSETLANILSGYAVVLDDGDLAQLAADYPTGIVLQPQQVLIALIGSSFVAGLRATALGVTSSAETTSSGVETFIFKVGKGRAILLSSKGQSIMLDAGAGASTTSKSSAATRLSAALANVIRGGLATPPSQLVLSHTDTDHMNAVEAVMAIPEMQATSIEIARQQLRSAVGSGDWEKMNISLLPTQKIIEIDVQGGSVHVQKRVLGNMEITEYRSVAAHQELMDTSRKTFNKNATCAVTIVRDLMSGQTQAFTADAEPKQLGQLVTHIGEGALRSILGGGGSNLTLSEGRGHHGGEVSGTRADVRGVLNWIRMSLETSNGAVRFFTQTSAAFSSSDSASIRYLDFAGIGTERIMDDPSAGQGSQVVRARGAELETITQSAGDIQQVQELVRTSETELMKAYRTRGELLELKGRVEIIRGALQDSEGAFAMVGKSLEHVERDVSDKLSGLEARLEAIWQAMYNGAVRVGMRGSNDRSAIDAEVQTLKSHLEKMNIDEVRSSVLTHERGLTTYERLFGSVFEMYEAMQKGDIARLNRLKDAQKGIFAEATGILGEREAAEHVRSSWAAVRAEWTGEKLRRVADAMGTQIYGQRQMMTEMRMQVAESFGRQLQLNEMMHHAEQGQLPRVTPIPMRTRAGAGAMAALEVIRIVLDLATATKASIESAAEREQQERVEGMREVLWWLRFGIVPKVALAARGWTGTSSIVHTTLSNDDILRVGSGTYSGSKAVPSHDRIVVTDVADADLLNLVNVLKCGSLTLADWIQRVGHPESNDSHIRRFDKGWAIWLWSEDDCEYRYVLKPALDGELNELMRTLEENQQSALGASATESTNFSPGTVRDSALLWGVERLLFVYNEHAKLERITVSSIEPQVEPVRTEYNWDLGEEVYVVRAVDNPTYKILSAYFWREVSGSWIGENSGGQTYRRYRNVEGWAYVRKQDLVQKRASGATSPKMD